MGRLRGWCVGEVHGKAEGRSFYSLLKGLGRRREPILQLDRACLARLDGSVAHGAVVHGECRQRRARSG